MAQGRFFDKLEPHEIKLLQDFSKIAEELFDVVAKDPQKAGQPAAMRLRFGPTRSCRALGSYFHDKDRRKSKLIGADHASNTLPYKRLKTAMDAWVRALAMAAGQG